MRKINSFQKCIKKIILEKPRWGFRFSSHRSIAMHFCHSKPTNEFIYYPRYSELRALFDLMIEEYGLETVLDELGVFEGDLMEKMNSCVRARLSASTIAQAGSQEIK